MYSAYTYCYSNPVRFNDPTGLFGSEEEANNYHTELGGSAAKIWQAEDGRWHVTMSKDGTDYYRPSEGAEVVKYQSVWAKINTFFAEGNADPANEGNITVQDVRAVANGMEAISDGADAAGVATAATGVGVEFAAGSKLVGTIAGAVSDAINIGADLYEGKYDDVIKEAVGTAIGRILPNFVKATTKQTKIVRDVVVDKSVDYSVNRLKK